MEKSSSDKVDEEDIPEVKVDVLGHPILPMCNVVALKSRQDVVREIFTKAYGMFDFSYLTMMF